MKNGWIGHFVARVNLFVKRTMLISQLKDLVLAQTSKQGIKKKIFQKHILKAALAVYQDTN